MPYVARDDQGQIIDAQERETASVHEQVALDDPELVSYLNGRSDDEAPADIRAELEASDLELIRVIEDVITVLIDKRIFMLTDLPAAAQQKLARRYNLRSKLSDLGGIISDHEDIMLP
jgi:FMN phosphatase YigB (HAD superfamily)